MLNFLGDNNMTSVKISSLHESDIDDVVVLEQSTSATPLSADTFISEMKNPTYIILVAHRDNEEHNAVGFTAGQLVSDELHIHSLAVDELWRRKGIARELVNELFFHSKKNGATKATLEVRVSNAAARELYKSLGFIEEGIRSKYYSDNGEDAIIMWLYSLENAS